MQMIHDSLMPEAMAKFLREEALRPVSPMMTFLGGAPATSPPPDPMIARAEQIQVAIKTKRDRDAEEADRIAFTKRRAMEAAP